MRSLVLAASTLAFAGCALDEPALDETTQASTVADHVQTTCTTAVVLELSRQIAGEVGCMAPGQLVPFAEGNGVEFAGAAVLPYVSEAARSDLADAVAAGGGRALQLTSVYRTLPQQYLLYRWFQLGRCGIADAATPGASNHESGRAIDVSNWAEWVDDLAGHGWAHDVPGDDVHFDHTASPDLRGTDVLAFQRLWNRNNPSMVIDEDGVYGPMTAMALLASPAEGFAQGPECAPLGFDAALDRIAAPRALAAGERARLTITVRNSGSLTWPAGTTLVTAEPLGRASLLADATWIDDAHLQALPVEVAPGGVASFAVEIHAPSLADDRELTEAFTLEAGADHFGAIALVVTITGDDSGGCSAGGGSAGAGTLGLIALGLLTGRRRPSRASATRDRR